MDSGTENDSLLLLVLLLAIREGSDSQHITGVSSICLAEHLPFKSVFGLGIRLQLVEVPLQI